MTLLVVFVIIMVASWAIYLVFRPKAPAVRAVPVEVQRTATQPAAPRTYSAADVEVLRKVDAYSLSDDELQAILDADAADELPRSRRASLPRKDAFIDAARELEYFSDPVKALSEMRLVSRDGAMVMKCPLGLINYESRHLYKIGIYCFSPRGTAYYPDAMVTANLSPGTTVWLVREPGNEYDKNAVALTSRNGAGIFGYVNKQNAARIAKRIDGGDSMAALSLAGNASGENHLSTRILVGLSDVLAALRSH